MLNSVLPTIGDSDSVTCFGFAMLEPWLGDWLREIQWF
jgi:hypothetical protein